MNLDNYPRVKHFLKEHPKWTLDQALEWTEKQLEGEGNGSRRIH